MKKVLVVIVVGLLGVIGYLMNEQVELQKQYDQLEENYTNLHKIHHMDFGFEFEDEEEFPGL